MRRFVSQALAGTTPLAGLAHGSEVLGAPKAPVGAPVVAAVGPPRTSWTSSGRWLLVDALAHSHPPGHRTGKGWTTHPPHPHMEDAVLEEADKFVHLEVPTGRLRSAFVRPPEFAQPLGRGKTADIVVTTANIAVPKSLGLLHLFPISDGNGSAGWRGFCIWLLCAFAWGFGHSWCR